MDTSKLHDQRFLISPDATFPAWVHPSEVMNYPGWIDATEMAPEEFQALVAEKLAVRPHIVGMAV